MTTTGTMVRIGDCNIITKEYNGKRVVTFKDIDLCHGRPEGTARKRFNDNKAHFIESVDFFTVNQPSEIRTLGITRPQGGVPDKVTIVTESGYLMLVKSFTDDLAWDVQRQLVNTYFRVQQLEEVVVEQHKQIVSNQQSQFSPLDEERIYQIALEACGKFLTTVLSDGSSCFYVAMENVVDKILYERIRLLTKPVEPNRNAIDIWKNNVVNERVDALMNLSGFTREKSFEVIYRIMREKYGFDESVAKSEFFEKYELESDTPILDIIADNALYRNYFVSAFNRLRNHYNKAEKESEPKKNEPLQCRTIEFSPNEHPFDFINRAEKAFGIQKECEVEIQAKNSSEVTLVQFTVNDSYDYILDVMADIFDDFTQKHYVIRNKIYALMNTQKGWKHSLTRNHCQTKKALIEKRPKYKKRFVEVCNELIRED